MLDIQTPTKLLSMPGNVYSISGYHHNSRIRREPHLLLLVVRGTQRALGPHLKAELEASGRL
jgi:hypothetical protein